jgi:hypothetical protein
VDFKSKSLPQNPKTTRTQFTILQKKKKKKRLQNPTKPVKQKKKHRIIDRIQVINTKLNTQLWNQSNFTFPPNSSPWPIKNQTPNHQIHANPFPLTNKEAREYTHTNTIIHGVLIFLFIFNIKSLVSPTERDSREQNEELSHNK